MKKITEMNDQEILALTNADLETLIKVEMAEGGIKLLDKPKEPEYVLIPAKDDAAFSVNGFNFLFKDKEDAYRVSELMTSLRSKFLRAEYKSDFSLRYLKQFTDDDYNFSNAGDVAREEFYKRETALSIKEHVKANEKLKKRYEEDLREYNDVYDSAGYIRDEIYNKYRTVQDKHNNLGSMKSKFIQYKELANGDTDIAMNFLKKAYTIDAETEAFVLA